MCHNCAARGLSRDPVPTTVEGLRHSLARDRRWRERRGDEPDGRLEGGERRLEDRRGQLAGTDEGIGNVANWVDGDEWIDADGLIVEVFDTPEEKTNEVTHIMRLPAE